MSSNDPILWAAGQIHRHLLQHATRLPEELRRSMRTLLESHAAVATCWRQIEQAQSRG